MSDVVVLVDFDNVGKAESRSGLDYVVRKVISICEPKLKKCASHVRFRLYGGWYEAGRMTQVAQKLVGEMREVSPVRVVRPDGALLWVKVELANSLLADPATLVDNTYRKRQVQSNLLCKSSPWSGCVNSSDCSCSQFQSFFNQGCVAPGCSVKGRDVLERAEQKVVDSMLVADLIYASNFSSDLVLVSRDDDMWPGLRMAVISGCTLVHLLTTPLAQLPKYYSSLRGGAYSCEVWK